MRRLAAVLASLAALGCLAVPGSAAGASLPVSALSDTAEVPTRPEALLTIRGLRAGCPRGRAASARPLSIRRALAASDKVLRRGAGKRRLAAFRRGRPAKRPRAAQELGVAALAKHNPAGALAGFLAAHARDRRNPLHLLNASVMLTRLGKPREALALVAAAERLRKPRRTPMGIGVRALALNNRGFALIALRQFGQAERVLRRAAAAEPLLAEAKLNLAMARLCARRFSQAVDPYIAGQRRSVSGGIEVTALQPDAGKALDMAFGRPGEPPKLTLPATPDDGVASAPAWKQLEQQRSAEATQLADQAGRALEDMSAALTGRPPLEQTRTLQILALFNARDRQRPAIAAARQAVLDGEQPLRDAYGDWQTQYNQIFSGCQDTEDTSEEIQQCVRDQCVPATVAQHNRWLELIRASDANLRLLARELHEYASGLAANLSSPVSQRAIMIATQHEIMTLYYSHVVLEIASRTGAEETLKEDCAASGGEATGETDPSDFPFPPACPPELQGVKIAFSIDFASFNVSCESVSVQVSLPNTLSPFAQVNYGFASGSTTVFAGARVGGRLPGISANARAGVYMSFNSRGEPTDVGLRGQVSAGGPSLPGVGGPSVGGKLDYSLAGTFL